MGVLPTCSALRPQAFRRLTAAHQVRHATHITRHRRPYTFTQLVQLSDGSTYTMRTTSPLGLYRSTRDTRNTLTWQPSEKSLRNLEADEAGKLAAFRQRFGHSFDSTSAQQAQPKNADADAEKERAAKYQQEQHDAFAEMMAGYAAPDRAKGMADAKVTKKKK